MKIKYLKGANNTPHQPLSVLMAHRSLRTVIVNSREYGHQINLIKLSGIKNYLGAVLL